jgi:hypothetical protein
VPDSRSFAIGSPNGIKVSKYYHIPNFLYCPSVFYVRVRCVPIAAS